MNIKVSVLIPVYKVENYIERCLRSVFEQTYDDVEYVIVNDCSPDKSMDVLLALLDEYPARKEQVLIINNERNLGIAEVRNICLSNAKGDYLYFVDSDDFISQDTLAKFVSVVLSEKADIVRCNYYENSGDGGLKLVVNVLAGNRNELLNNAIRSLSGIDAMWKLFFHRSLIEKYSLSFELGINACEDYVMSVKLFYFSTNTVDIEDALYYYTVAGNESSYTKNSKLFLMDKIKAAGVVYFFLKDHALLNIFRDAIYARILMCKQIYLISRADFDLDKYYSIYPEVNGAWRDIPFGYREKILFWLAEYKLTWMIKWIYAW